MLSVGEADASLLMPALRTVVRLGPHQIVADEPAEPGTESNGGRGDGGAGQAGGGGEGGTPMQLLLGALAACTTMTIALYVKRKGWSLDEVRARAIGQRSDERAGPFERIELAIELSAELTDEQRSRILSVAERCPVHRTLAGGVPIVSRLIG